MEFREYIVTNIVLAGHDGYVGPKRFQVSEAAIANDQARGIWLNPEEMVRSHFDTWQEDDRLVSFDVRVRKSTSMIGVEAYTLGEVTRCYGGPEEGGWYYDAFDPERVFYVSSKRAARLLRLLDRLVEARNEGRRGLSSVLSDGRAAIEHGVAGRTPRPQYS